MWAQFFSISQFTHHVEEPIGHPSWEISHLFSCAVWHFSAFSVIFDVNVSMVAIFIASWVVVVAPTTFLIDVTVAWPSFVMVCANFSSWFLFCCAFFYAFTDRCTAIFRKYTGTSCTTVYTGTSIFFGWLFNTEKIILR